MYFVLLEPEAILDIQEAIDYYDLQQVGLGKKFEKELNEYLLKLEKNPFFSLRYDSIHCLPLKKFPFMIHYSIHEITKQVIIRAVFHTAQNPTNWINRNPDSTI